MDSGEQYRDEEFWYGLALYWDDFLTRYGVDRYLEARYGLGEQQDHANVRMSGLTTVDR